MMKSFYLTMLIELVMIVSGGMELCHANEAKADLVIIQKGSPSATVVVPDSPDAVVAESARLLIHYLKRATGVELKRAEESKAREDGVKIYMGPTKAARKLGLDASKLVSDGYVMKAHQGSLFLWGRDQLKTNQAASMVETRGTLRSVLDFLRDHAGVRWILPVPEGDWVPSSESIRVPANLDVKYHPPLLFFTPRFDRFTFPWTQAHGARIAVNYYSGGGHTWQMAIPNLEEQRKTGTPEDLKKAIDQFALTHGEMYATLNPSHLFKNGKNEPVRLDTPKGYFRDNGYNPHFCTSHPDFVPMLTQWVQTKFDQGYDLVEVGESDGYRPCSCPRCIEKFGAFATTEEVESKFEAYGRRVVIPHLQVAENCFKSHPKKFIIFPCYSRVGKYLTADKDHGYRFPPNSLIYVADTHRNLDRLKQYFRVDPFQEHYWGAMNYVYWFSIWHDGLSPKQNPESIAFQVQNVLKMRYFGVYICGGGENFPAEGALYYVLFRTLEQPTKKPWDLVNEYCRGLYGAAAKTMYDYHTLLYREVRVDPKTGVPGEVLSDVGALAYAAPQRSQRYNEKKYMTFWPDTNLKQMDALLNKATEEASGDSRATSFIRLARIGFEQIYYTQKGYEAFLAYEKSPGEDLKLAVRKAVKDRVHWMEKIRSLKTADPEFVLKFFPNYDKFVSTMETEKSVYSPLTKPFIEWE